MASESASRAARPDALTQQIPKGHPGIPGVTLPLPPEGFPPKGGDEEMPEWFKKWLTQQGQHLPNRPEPLEGPEHPERPDDTEFPEIIADGPPIHLPAHPAAQPGGSIAENRENYTRMDEALNSLPGAIKSDWFGVAAEATSWNAVGAASPWVPNGKGAQGRG